MFVRIPTLLVKSEVVEANSSIISKLLTFIIWLLPVKNTVVRVPVVGRLPVPLQPGTRRPFLSALRDWSPGRLDAGETEECRQRLQLIAKKINEGWGSTYPPNNKMKAEAITDLGLLLISGKSFSVLPRWGLRCRNRGVSFCYLQ